MELKVCAWNNTPSAQACDKARCTSEVNARYSTGGLQARGGRVSDDTTNLLGWGFSVVGTQTVLIGPSTWITRMFRFRSIGELGRGLYFGG